MDSVTESLATEFERANDELIGTVENLSDAQWNTLCSGEERSVGVLAHHVALSHLSVAGMAKTIADGASAPPVTMEMIDQGNAEHAREHTDADRAETVELLRQNGMAAAGIVRALSDEQLERTATVLGRQMSAGQMIEAILIGHPRNHLASIQAAL